MIYVYRDGALVPKTEALPKDGLALSDIEPFQAPDGTWITSRSRLRAYEQKNGVRQVGNDWTGPERPAFWDSIRRK